MEKINDNIDSEDLNKIKKIKSDRQKAHKYYSERSSVYRSFTDMEKKTFTDGSLSKMHKELIAIGISIVSNCESCLEWHIKQAKAAGATERQIIEAIEVGFEMGIGPTTVSARFAMKILEYYKK